MPNRVRTHSCCFRQFTGVKSLIGSLHHDEYQPLNAFQCQGLLSGDHEDRPAYNVSMPDIRDRRLFELTCAAVKFGLDFVAQQQKKNAYIGAYSNIPELRYFDNGMPSFSKVFEGPTDYK